MVASIAIPELKAGAEKFEGIEEGDEKLFNKVTEKAKDETPLNPTVLSEPAGI
jgi:hypothetical protein